MEGAVSGRHLFGGARVGDAMEEMEKGRRPYGTAIYWNAWRGARSTASCH